MKRIALCLFLSGCMVGPNYHKPETAMPSSFETKSDAEITSDETLRGWWKQLGDPLLDSLVEEAVRGNYDWRIAVEQIVETRAKYRIERSYLFPEVDLNAAANRSRFSDNLFTSSSIANSTAAGSSPSSVVSSDNFPVPGTIQNFFQVGFDAIWELDIFGKFRRNKRAAYDLWEASQESAQDVLITLISEVAREYVSIRSLQQQILLTHKKIEADERLLYLAEVLFDAGLDNQIQIENLIATLQTDRAALPPLETALKQTIYGLAYLLGKQPEGFAAQFEELSPIPVSAGKVPGGLPSDLLRRRPDIRAAERQLAAATEMIGVAIADLFPHISLTGNTYGFESNKQNKWLIGASRYWNIGPSLNWNLLDFGRVKAQIRVQNSVQQQALLTYEQTVISSLRDVEGALVAYFEEQKRMADFEREVSANRRALELTEDLFAAGLFDELQVLSAIKTWIDSENHLIQSQQALTSNLIALYKALGGDWECFSSP